MTGEDDWIKITLKNGNPLFSACIIGSGLYELPVLVKCRQAYLSVTQFWYEALGQSSLQTWTHAVERYSDGKLLPPHPSKFFCEQCVQCNAKNIAPTPTNQLSSIPFDLVHTDLAGPFSVQSLGGVHYYMTVIDDCTRYMQLYLLNKKSEAIKYLQE